MSSRFQIFNIRDSKFWRTYWENIIKSCKKSSQKCVTFTIMLHRFGTNRLASMQISISDWSQNMFFWGNKSGDKLVTFCLFGSHKRSALKWADHISRQKVPNFDWGKVTNSMNFVKFDTELKIQFLADSDIEFTQTS